jgi:hypothetical protein
MNNPLKYTDPSGYSAQTASWQEWIDINMGMAKTDFMTELRNSQYGYFAEYSRNMEQTISKMRVANDYERNCELWNQKGSGLFGKDGYFSKNGDGVSGKSKYHLKKVKQQEAPQQFYVSKYGLMKRSYFDNWAKQGLSDILQNKNTFAARHYLRLAKHVTNEISLDRDLNCQASQHLYIGAYNIVGNISYGYRGFLKQSTIGNISIDGVPYATLAQDGWSWKFGNIVGDFKNANNIDLSLFGFPYSTSANRNVVSVTPSTNLQFSVTPPPLELRLIVTSTGVK